jgi:5'-methylthioadenosine phosphorylase
MAMITDYDCWREGEAAVEVEAVIAQLQANAATAGRMLVELAKALPETREPSPIDTVLDMAMITPAEARDPTAMAKLDAVCRRLFQA